MAQMPVKRTYLCSPTDLPLIEDQISEPGAAVCVSPEAFQGKSGLCLTPAALSKIRQSEELVYVLSKDSACSTAYQVLVLASIPEARTKLRFRLIFDKAPIPLGFAELRSLPDVGGAQHRLRMLLYRMFGKLAA